MGSRKGERARSPLHVEVVAPRALKAAGVAGWLRRIAPARARGHVTVAVTTDARIRVLNRAFRRKDAVTDVLSFPSDEPPHLGDIVIAAGAARRHARSAGHSIGVELRVLALHGLLHLLGYDHEQDDGAMARLERRLRRRGGLPEGLIERS
jgi:probable rRNA maturation factor